MISVYGSIDLDLYRHYRNELLQQYRDLKIDPHILNESREARLYFALWGQYSPVLDDYAAFLAARDSSERTKNPAEVAHLGHTTLIWFAASWEWIGFYLKRLFSLKLPDKESYPDRVFGLILDHPHIRIKSKNLIRKIKRVFDDSATLRNWKDIHFHRYLGTHFFVARGRLHDGLIVPVEVIRNRNNTCADLQNLSSLLADSHQKLCRALKISRGLFLTSS